MPERIDGPFAELFASFLTTSSSGFSLASREVGGLARRSDLAEALNLWTYVWELDRRSRGKGKGPLVHALWPGCPARPDRT